MSGKFLGRIYTIMWVLNFLVSIYTIMWALNLLVKIGMIFFICSNPCEGVSAQFSCHNPCEGVSAQFCLDFAKGKSGFIVHLSTQLQQSSHQLRRTVRATCSALYTIQYSLAFRAIRPCFCKTVNFFQWMQCVSLSAFHFHRNKLL